MDKQAKEKARYFEGSPPEDFTLVGAAEGRTFRTWYYQDRKGDFWRTSRKLSETEKENAGPGLEVWQDAEGRTFARRL